MMIQQTLDEKFRSTYFELISNMTNAAYEELLTATVYELKRLLNTTHAAIYAYNNWNRTYELKTDAEDPALLKSKINYSYDFIRHHDDVLDGTLLFNRPNNLLEAVVIPITIENEVSVFLFVSYPNNTHILTQEIIHVLKRETYQILKLINNMTLNRRTGDKNAFLFNLSNNLNAMVKKEDILTELFRSLRDMYPAFSCFLLLAQDYEGDSVLPVQTIAYSDEPTKRISQQVLLTGEYYLEERVLDNQTCLYIALSGNQGVYGVLQILTPQIADFTDGDIDFIVKFITIAGTALENVTRQQHSEHLVSNLKLINETAQRLNANLNLSEIISILRDKIIDVYQATEIGFIFNRNNSLDGFDLLEGSTEFFFTEKGEQFTAYLTEKLKTDPKPVFKGRFDLEGDTLPYNSVLAIPMIQSGTVHGEVVLLHESPYFFSFDTYKVMQSLVRHSTLAFTNAMLKDELEKTVKTDYLTGLYSRNYLDETIQTHMKTDEKGVLILFDIDDFKLINDTYGHYIGDEVIVQVAAIIRKQLGESEISARWGGEELAVYMPNATCDDGVVMALQTLQEVENVSEPNVTLSSGVAFWDSQKIDTAMDVFKRADRALYEAKNTGKNSVVKENALPNNVN